jgi:hypothetical protein
MPATRCAKSSDQSVQRSKGARFRSAQKRDAISASGAHWNAISHCVGYRTVVGLSRGH